MVSGGATPPWSPKKAALICAKFAMMFLYVTMTPTGVRVDPEVYCKYTVSAAFSTLAGDAFFESRSSESTSMSDGTAAPDFDSKYSAISPRQRMS